MKIKLGLILVLLLLVLSGCGGASSSISTSDLAIHKIGDDKAKVEYGMARSDAEKVLGQGEKTNAENEFEYESGVKIKYKDDKVVGFVLEEDAKDTYQTPKLKIGMLKSDFLAVYGKNNARNVNERGASFCYDAQKDLFLNEKTKESFEKDGSSDEIYDISASFDKNGYTKRIYLIDLMKAY